MRAIVNKSSISGSVSAPPSKSAMQRYIAGSLLSQGTTKIYSPSFCEDSMASMAMAEALGAEIIMSDNVIMVHGGFNPKQANIFCDESGLATRMFTPVAALHNQEITINGKGSILNRPIKMMETTLVQLGVEISSNNGYLPIKVKGPLLGGRANADGSVSSQFITGLLMALPVTPKDSQITVDNLVSRPYIDLTIRILEEFKIEISNHGYQEFSIRGRQKYSAGDFVVEGDWSGGAFLLVMGALGGEAEVKNLNLHSAQADKAIFNALALAGAKISGSDKNIHVIKSDLHGFSFDISDCPDLAPPLAILGLACNGKTVITGTGRLNAKESDRGKILETTLTSLGGRIKNSKDKIEIEGGIPLKGGSVNANNDHRIAMALASAALFCDSPVIIDGMECIKKSYPGFVDDYISLGGKIKLL